jgi:DNA polymerase (family X)
LRREPSKVNIDTLATAAARHGVALEINCHADRLDLSDVHARAAIDRGAKLVISSDAHSRAALQMTAWGVLVARRAWARADDVLNTRPFEDFRASLRRHRSRP